MRRRRSDELPRYAEESEWTSFRPRRRYAYYAVAFLVVCWILYPSRSAKPEADHSLRVNWSSYAYSVYATDTASLCHAVMILDALARFGSKADRVLFYPDYWDTRVASSKDRDSQLLILARDTYKAKLYPVKPLQVAGRTEGVCSHISPGRQGETLQGTLLIIFCRRLGMGRDRNQIHGLLPRVLRSRNRAGI